MNRFGLHALVGAVTLLLAAVFAPAASAQTTYFACRVPGVGVIYIRGTVVTDPCLDPAHVQFQWSEGGAPPANSVTSAMIVDGTITAADIANTTITGPKLAAGAVGSTEVLDNSLGQADIATDGVGAAEIAANAVGTAEIADGAVTGAKLAAGAAFRTVRTVQSVGTSISAASTAFVYAYCSAGETALAGGSANMLTAGVNMIQLFPTTSAGNSGWGVSFHNTTGFTQTIYAYAICAS